METESCRLWYARRMEYGYTEEGKGLYVDFRNYRKRSDREYRRLWEEYIAVHQKEEEKEKWEDQE